MPTGEFTDVPELSKVAERLARHLVHTSRDGLQSPIDWEVILERFSDADGHTLAEAAHELAGQQLLRVGESINAPDGIAHVCPDFSLYWLYDSEELGYPTQADVVELARHLLESDAFGSIPRLHEAVGWPRRRFNPALSYLVRLFPEGRVSQAAQDQYPTQFLVVTPEERMLLRDLIERLSSPEPEDGLGSSGGPTEASLARLKLPFVEFELPMPTWVALCLLVVVAAGTLLWHWPRIAQRLCLAEEHPSAESNRLGTLDSLSDDQLRTLIDRALGEGNPGAAIPSLESLDNEEARAEECRRVFSAALKSGRLEDSERIARSCWRGNRRTQALREIEYERMKR